VFPAVTCFHTGVLWLTRKGRGWTVLITRYAVENVSELSFCSGPTLIFTALSPLSIKTAVSWEVTPCGLVDGWYEHF
jgi:hypothetical protein